MLPQVFAEDPERRQRFEREARLLAALNRPSFESRAEYTSPMPPTPSSPVIS